MRIKSLINRINNVPKAIIGLIVIALLGTSMLTANIVGANDPAVIEGNTTILNVTSGETEYKDVTDMLVDEVAQVSVWLHNREAPGGQQAFNSKVKITVPSEAGKEQVITGRTSTDNSNTITDTTQANLSLDEASLEYVPGSAKFRYNKGAVDGREECRTGYDFPAENCYATIKISDDVVTSGVNLDEYRGTPLNGCNAYHETVIVQVRSVVEAISVNKYVRHLAENGEENQAWSTEASAKPGDKLQYLITYKNEGNKVLNNVMVGDNLPKYNSYVNDTTMLSNGNHPDGTSVSNNNVTKGGINTGNYNPGARGNVWFTAQLDPVTAYEKCGEYEVVNVGVVRAEGMNEYYNTAKVRINVECDEPEVATACTSLSTVSSNINVGESTEFTAEGTTNGPALTGFIFEINSDEVQNSGSNKYTFTAGDAGEYTIRATAKFENGNKTSDACVKTVTVVEETEPVYSCDDLTVQFVKKDTYKFTVATTARNGATVKDFSYDFGDDTEVMLTDKNMTEHTYTGPGTYNVEVTVRFDVDGEVKTASTQNCKTTVTFSEEMCTVPGKEHLPKGDPDCREQVRGVTTKPGTPTTLPNTGAGSIAGAFAALTAAGTVGHSFITRRRK